MALASKASRPDRTISSFFSPRLSAAPSRSADAIDLTHNDDVQPQPSDSDRPTKRPRKESETEESAAQQEMLSQWRMSHEAPSSDDAMFRAPTEIHRAFRAKLLGSQTLRRNEMLQIGSSSSHTAAEEEDEELSPQEQGPALDLSSFSAPTSGAATAGPSKASSTAGKGKSKEKAVGPSGLPYTPLEEQVLDLKQRHPGVLLVVEVGYRCRFFGEDAQIASRLLNVACFPDRNFLCAMIPVHRLQVHVRTLVAAGHKVGVVRQTETRALKAISSNSSKPFARELSAVYTAATWVDDLHVNADEDASDGLAGHSLVTILEQEAANQVTIAFVAVQVATGTVIYDEFPDSVMRSELETRLAHCNPIEILLPAKNKLSKLTAQLLKHTVSRGTSDGWTIRCEHLAASHWLTYDASLSLIENNVECARSVDDVTKGDTIAALFGLPHLAVQALAACLSHLEAFGLQALFQRSLTFQSFASRSSMILSANTLDNLEVLRNSTNGKETGSLIWLLGCSKTAMGKRLVRKWAAQPLMNLTVLKERGDAVEEIVDKMSSSATLDRAIKLLQGLPDLERGLARLSYGRSDPNELASFILSLNRIATEFESDNRAAVPCSSRLLQDCIFSLSVARETCHNALAAVNISAARRNDKTDLFVDTSQFPLLQDKRALLDVNAQEIRDHLTEIRRELKRPSLQFVTVADTEFLVEVLRGETKKVPASWLRVNSTTKVVRFHTPQTRALMKQRDQIKEMLESEAQAAYVTFVDEWLNGHFATLRGVVVSVATLDALNSIATLSCRPGYTRPILTECSGITLKQFRHPMGEALHSYIPNDVSIGREDEKGILLTGSNMGGKSSTVRAIALIVLLAQIGAYVPAEAAELSLHDTILTRMGASDDLARSRSTFRVEMEETAEILRASTGRSLVILDELGRGTSTNDGMAVAFAVLQHLMTRPLERCPTTLFITHYFALGSIADETNGRLRNMHMAHADDEDGQGRNEITFLYRLRDGLASSSFGINCAALAGLPESILEVAARESRRIETEAEANNRRRRSRHLAKAARALFAPGADISAAAAMSALNT